MKTGLLLFSLAFNAILIVFYVKKDTKPSTPPGERNVLRGVKTTEPGGASVIHVTTNAARLDWTMVESPDYRTYVANLRAIGCPEETIRDIIVADVNKLFEQRTRELGPVEGFDYWKAGNSKRTGINADRLQKHLASAQEKSAILKELLGIDFKDNSVVLQALDPLRAKYAFLSPARQQQMLELEAKYATKVAEIFGRVSGDASDPRYAELMDQKNAEMAQLLSPQEFEDYQVRYSPIAQRIRDNLGEFAPTEQEFRHIHRQLEQFESQFGTSDKGLSPEQRDARVGALTETRNQLRQLMGEERFSDYEHESGLQRSSLKDVARQYNLPKESVFRALDANFAAQEEAMRIRTNPNFSEEQRQQMLIALRDQLETSLSQFLTPEGYAAYMKQRHAWMSVFPNRQGNR